MQFEQDLKIFENYLRQKILCSKKILGLKNVLIWKIIISPKKYSCVQNNFLVQKFIGQKIFLTRCKTIFVNKKLGQKRFESRNFGSQRVNMGDGVRFMLGSGVGGISLVRWG